EQVFWPADVSAGGDTVAAGLCQGTVTALSAARRNRRIRIAFYQCSLPREPVDSSGSAADDTASSGRRGTIRRSVPGQFGQSRSLGRRDHARADSLCGTDVPRDWPAVRSLHRRRLDRRLGLADASSLLSGFLQWLLVLLPRPGRFSRL